MKYIILSIICLATNEISPRENPRAKILKKEAKNKHIPDIPLPFNKIDSEDEDGEGSGGIGHPTPKNIIPLKDFEKFDLLTRVVGNHLHKMAVNNKRGVSKGWNSF